MAKKNFQNVQNPALAFISTPQGKPAKRQQAADTGAGLQVKPYKKPEKKATKDRRVQLALLPSVYEMAVRQQKRGGYPSLNEYFHALIEAAERGQNEN